MNKSVLSNLNKAQSPKNEFSTQNDQRKRSFINPFSEALHHNVPDYKSLGIFVTEPITPNKIYLWVSYSGKPIDVIAELKRRGIDLTKAPHLWDLNSPFPSFLDLKYFEDTDLAPLSPESYLSKLKEIPPFAFRFYKGAVTLEPIIDISYSKTKHLYSIRYRDGKPATLSPLFVLFPFDDPYAFIDRLERAFQLRRLEESWFRYWLYTKKIPRDDLQDLTQSDKQRLLNKVTINNKYKIFSVNGEKFSFSKKILEEINSQMQIVTNSMIFNIRLFSNPFLYRGLMLPLHRLPGEMQNITPLNSNSSINLNDRIKSLQSVHLFNNEWFVNSAPIIVSWSLDLSNSSLFNLICPHPLPLDQWQRHHRNYEKAMISKARMKFISQISTVLFDVIRNIKLPYSLTEFNKIAYLESPFGRFVGLCNQIIQSHLVDFLENSLYWFKNYIIENNPVSVDIIDYRSVKNQYLQSINRIPLYIVVLELIDGELHFQPPLDYFLNAINEEIEYSISSFEDFQKIETSILKAMMWTPVPVYKLPDMESKSVIELKDTINNIIKSSLDHLQSYIIQLQPFDGLLKGNAIDFANKLKESDADLNKVKRAISEVINQQKEIHLNFPFKVDIGIFQVDLSMIRKALYQKLHERRLALLQMLISISFNKMKEIQKSYDNMWAKLLEEPKTIEALVSQRDFISNIDSNLATVKTHFSEVLSYLDTVEDMCVSIPDEQDSLRWELVGYEKKIRSKSIDVSKLLKVTQSQLAKALQCDKMMLTSQVTSITSAIAGVFAFNDITQHMSYVARVRGIQSKLDEALEKSDVYNMREKLSGTEQTDYSLLKSQLEAFTPYKIFWEASSSWKVSVEKWRKVPLSQLNANDVESQFALIQQQLVQSSRIITDKEILAISQSIRGEMDSFKKYIPIFSIMLNPGMT